jgi:hypothetical protein
VKHIALPSVNHCNAAFVLLRPVLWRGRESLQLQGDCLVQSAKEESDMTKGFRVIALAVFAFGFGYAPCCNAGTEMLIDNSAQAPPPAPPPAVYYPPPPPVYYAPPAIGVAVFPRHRFFAPARVIVFRRPHRRVVFVR